MASYNKHGQWTLSGNEDSLMFKTNETRYAGKQEVEERDSVDIDSSEAKAFFKSLARTIMDGVPKQPSNEEMFGHLVPTEEQIQKAEIEWENRIQLGYDTAQKPIDPDHNTREWGNGQSFRERLNDEERAQYEKEERELNKSIR